MGMSGARCSVYLIYRIAVSSIRSRFSAQSLKTYGVCYGSNQTSDWQATGSLGMIGCETVKMQNIPLAPYANIQISHCEMAEQICSVIPSF